jgi:hypothetical protein
MWKLIVGTLVLLGLGIAGALVLAGWFDQPVFMEKGRTLYQLIFEKIEGEYQQAGGYTDRMAEWLKQQGIKTSKGFGLYFDHPLEVSRGRLRFIAGQIIEETDFSRLPDLPRTYLAKTFPRQVCIKAIIPYRTRLSPLFGITKVYPALDKKLAERGDDKNPVMEIYDRANKLIVYLMPTETGTQWLDEFYLKPVLEGQAAPVTPTATAR